MSILKKAKSVATNPVLGGGGTGAAFAGFESLTAGGNPLQNLQNIMMGNGASGQHSGGAQAAKLNAALQTPEAAQFSSGLNNGQLSSNLVLNKPGDVAADHLTAGKLGLGGTLNAQQLAALEKAGLTSIMPDAEARFAGIKADDRGINAFRERALNEGPSAWNKLQKDSQRLQEMDSLENSVKSSATQAAQAQAQLAMRGGLSSGSRERMARNAAQDAQMAAQAVRRQGQMDRTGIDTKDEEMRMQALSQLPGMDLAWIQPDMDKAKILTGVQSDEQLRQLDADKFNIGNTKDINVFNATQRSDADRFNITNRQDVDKYNIGTALDADKFNIGNKFDAQKYNTNMAFETNKYNNTSLQSQMAAQNAFNQNKYNQEMAQYGANRTANATLGAGKK